MKIFLKKKNFSKTIFQLQKIINNNQRYVIYIYFKIDSILNFLFYIIINFFNISGFQNFKKT